MLTPRDSRHRYRIDHITNGVHLATWVSPPFAAVFDDHIPGWREDNSSLRGVLGIPGSEIWQAHAAAKRQLVDAVNQETNAGFDLDVLTLGFARRFATYKRPALLLRDPARLKAISANVGRIQVVYAGKAHPQDEAGKELIREVFRVRALLEPEVRVAFLQDYNWETARLLVAGCDVWLNTPEPPNEASGTSGMKAALNGVPSLSVADGWWLEGCIENLTGWTVGDAAAAKSASPRDESADSTSLLDLLERVVIPQFYSGRDRFLRIMQHAIALNASYFNTQRMLQEYIAKAYLN